MRQLVYVNCPHLCCGIVSDFVEGKETIVEAAPIMKWAIGKPIEEVYIWVSRKRGSMEYAPTHIKAKIYL